MMTLTNHGHCEAFPAWADTEDIWEQTMSDINIFRVNLICYDQALIYFIFMYSNQIIAYFYMNYEGNPFFLLAEDM